MLKQAVSGFIDAGIATITIKIRNPTSRAILHDWAEYLSASTGSVIEVCSELNLGHHLAQADILLCHGSATSTLEALYHRVTPVIAPSHNDTYFVAQRCADSNTAVTIDWATDFTRAHTRAAATEALHSPRIAKGIDRFILDNDGLPPASTLAEQLRRSDRRGWWDS
ncbi:glycosyltransferase [Nocardia sp. NPDC051570]|uniref:glycosyltransferase n=1 Tax=Nocardia sp. NPDC051570 TaxID=3364324 RepID=UPI0037AFA54D